MAYTAESFIKKIAPLAVEDMKNSGILASLTLAQACLESSYGNSGLTTSANNLFGMKGTYKGDCISLPTTEYERGVKMTINANFRKYPTWAESISDHSTLFTSASRYANLVGEKDYKVACTNVQKDGYATDPNYTTKLIGLIEKYNFTQYDQQAATGDVIKLRVILNGVEKEVEALQKDGVNFVKLRDLADSYIIVDYDAEKKMPVIKLRK